MSPSFEITEAYLARLDDLEYWRPLAITTFERHGIDADMDRAATGRVEDLSNTDLRYSRDQAVTGWVILGLGALCIVKGVHDWLLP